MKIRIISLLLCLLLLVPMFTACSNKNNEGAQKTEIDQTSTRTAKTIGMYVITGSETKPEAAQAVEDAINKLVKSKYTTKVDITFLTADEYYAKVEEQFSKMKSASTVPAAAAEETSGEPTITTEATVVNEYGVTELKYPEIPDYQIDLLFIDSYDKLTEYAKNGWLYSLSDSLKNTYKKLTDYIYPSFISAATIGDTIYAVPNNRMIGDECKYLILDSALTNEFGLDVSKVNSLADLEEFFAWVKANKPGVTPISDTLDVNNAVYLNVDSKTRTLTNNFSLVGSMPKTGATSLEIENLFADEKYKNELLALAKFKFEDYCGTGEKYAAELKTGNAYDMAQYSNDYDIVVVQGDSEKASELCSSMFAVSKFTSDLKRSMEVLTYLNTDSEIRDLLQYGIKGTNYTVDPDTDMLTRLNRDYMMDLDQTGNVYMAHTEEGVENNVWKYAKLQNIASMPYNTINGFKLPDDTEDKKVDFAAASELAKASVELKDALNSCTTYEAYAALVNGASEKYADVINAFLATKTTENTPLNLYLSSLN